MAVSAALSPAAALLATSPNKRFCKSVAILWSCLPPPPRLLITSISFLSFRSFKLPISFLPFPVNFIPSGGAVSPLLLSANTYGGAGIIVGTEKSGMAGTGIVACPLPADCQAGGEAGMFGCDVASIIPMAVRPLTTIHFMAIIYLAHMIYFRIFVHGKSDPKPAHTSGSNDHLCRS
ncbi:MAG: hypothetical protein JWQ98_1050 [Chlorobi bacterium]|nr:hypothetical protein [Chlorobiota bacterium]